MCVWLVFYFLMFLEFDVTVLGMPGVMAETLLICVVQHDLTSKCLGL